MIPLLFLLLLITPIVHEETDDGCRLSKDIMSEEEISHNSVIQTFLAKYPDAQLATSVDESSPPVGFMAYSTSEMNLSIVTKGCKIPAIYILENDSFKIKMPTEIAHAKSSLEGIKLYYESEIVEVIHDLFLKESHEKWFNVRNETVYVFPESAQELSQRGYLVEQTDFFDFEKLKKG